MRLYDEIVDFDHTIERAKKLKGTFNRSVIFHCYWHGDLSEMHLLSVRSCFYFNVFRNRENRIIVWVEKSRLNKWAIELNKYAEVREFDIAAEERDTPWEGLGTKFELNAELGLPRYANYIRMLLLYKYTGLWFDLDVYFLRSFSPIFANFSHEVFVYTWEYQNYPNNAIVGNINGSSVLEKAMYFIRDRKLGWGFQQAGLTFDLPLDFLVLPCSWFDPGWVPNPFNVNIFDHTSKSYDFENYFAGAFTYHWHNNWHKTIEKGSVLQQLDSFIVERL